MGVYGGGKLVYLAVEPEFAEAELLKLFSDIKILLRNKLTVEEILYFSSMIHLVFVKIHPFMDGNGRAARLLEKWFLAAKLGNAAWFLESEKFSFCTEWLIIRPFILARIITNAIMKNACPFC